MFTKLFELIPLEGEAVRTALWRVLVTLLLIGHVGWACNWLPGLETGFAHASEVAENKSKLDRILSNQIIEQIEKILKFKCKNPGDDSLDQNLRELEADYRELTGETYRRPNCEYLTG